MPKEKVMTTIRLDEDDRAIIAKLSSLTGLDSTSAIIRLSIREALAARNPKKRR